ncbi:MAG: O-antigen ligase family protein [Chlamydiae bacterium]|nr:O-antigen ligase family protein [Chlamydiota bacterium]
MNFLLTKKRILFRINLVDTFVFLYFLTLSGELLNIPVGLFKPRVNHIIAIVLFTLLIKAKKIICFDNTILLPTKVLMLSMLCSALFGEHLFRSLGYFCVFGFSFICYFLLPYNLFIYFDKERILKIYWASFLTIGAYTILQVLFSTSGIILPFVSQYAKNLARGQGWSYEPSFYALYMTSFVMFYNAIELFSVNKKINWLYFILVNFLLIASTSTGVIFSYPIFAVLYLLAGYMTLTRDYVEKVKTRVLQMLTFFFGSMAAIWFFFPEEFIITFYKFFNLGFTKHWSIIDRWKGIVKCFLVFKENPIFGVGIGGVGPYFYEVIENGGVATTLKEMEKHDPTNVFTEILASLGLVGLMSFGFLFYRYWLVFKEVMQRSLSLTIAERRTAIALMISLICTLIVLQFNQGLFRNYIWVHAAITLSYLRSLQRGLR